MKTREWVRREEEESHSDRKMSVEVRGERGQGCKWWREEQLRGQCGMEASERTKRARALIWADGLRLHFCYLLPLLPRAQPYKRSLAYAVT
jgi:hypothetical protein